jgi:hypothetical protein
MKKAFNLNKVYLLAIATLVTSYNLIQGMEPIIIKNNEGKSFTVAPVNTLEVLNTLSKNVGLDFRITKESLSGIDLDYEHTRSQVFTIQGGTIYLNYGTKMEV